MPKRDPTVYEPRYDIDNPPPSGFRSAVCAVSELENACATFRFAGRQKLSGPQRLDQNSDPRLAPTYRDAVARLFDFQEEAARGMVEE